MVGIHVRIVDEIYVFGKIVGRCPHPRGALPLRSPPAIRLAGPPASPCRSALNVVASFTAPVDIVSMHNLFLQEFVYGVVHVHVMYVCNPYVIGESRFLSAGWSIGAVFLLYNELRGGSSM